ncbi:MAG TPA: acyl-CoA reductase [Candidatus Baltobacteraceae bacterium]|nr:acyl-CoA reductase [Candidatus Baltobacteraceae bacterium]
MTSTALSNVPVKKILRAIASAAERWSDADFPPRVRASDRICERLGYSLPMVDYALDRLFFDLNENALRAVVENELGSLAILDEFTSRARRPLARAFPAGNVCVISSRTTIGVALLPALFALCAKCDVTVKDREDALLAAFFESLYDELDEFKEAANASAWHAGDEDAPDLTAFDVVVAFGSAATLAEIGNGLRYDTRYIPYGTRASAGYISRECTADTVRQIVPGAARDLILYESEGCLSLHVLFFENGGALSAVDFARTLAQAVQTASVEFPPAQYQRSQTASIAHRRDAAAFRAASGRGAVFSDSEAGFALFVDPPKSEPPPFLPRTMGIIPVDGPADALEYLRGHGLALEGFATAVERDDIVRLAVDSGAVRITTFGELQHPPLTGNHGGRPRIAEFVKWIDQTP